MWLLTQTMGRNPENGLLIMCYFLRKACLQEACQVSDQGGKVFINVCIEHVSIVTYIYMYINIIYYMINYYYVLDVAHSHTNCQVNYCDKISTLLAEF